MQRFPDEATHYKSRAKALDEWRIATKNSNARIALLQEERKKLEEERQFYDNDKVKKPLPHASCATQARRMKRWKDVR